MEPFAQEQVEDDRSYAASVADWERRAHAGRACSASPPAPLVTPKGRFSDRFAVELPSPPKAPEPYKKSQLAAAKRLEKELKTSSQTASKTTGESQDSKSKVKAKKTQKEKKTDTKKKAHDSGPLQDAMSKFLTRVKNQGASHKEALQMWRNSRERDAIVGKMSESERKRRRY